jgi:phenylalanyl-tRNA synthetase beta subunit
MNSNFKMWSLYPFISRDISVWLPESEDKNNLWKILKDNGTELLVRDPYLVDSFKKEGRVSYAFRLVFQSFERTLTDEEINKIMDQITNKIKEKGWEVR